MRFSDRRVRSLLETQAQESMFPFRLCKDWGSILTETFPDVLASEGAGQKGSRPEAGLFADPKRQEFAAVCGDDHEDSN